MIETEIRLSTGTIISYPHHPETSLECKESFSPNLRKTFSIKSIFNKSNYVTVHQVKGTTIINIWSIIYGFEEKACVLELSNGNFLLEGTMSPLGTGNTDLFLFKSRKEIENKYDDKLLKVY